jgi:capsule polysaccharide export protein KpsE/RkpR
VYKSTDNKFSNSSDLVQLAYRWRKPLFIVGMVSLVAAIIFSSPFFIRPKYKSFAIVYPSNLIAYSTESATEQMLQLAQSYDIRDKVINTFHLYEHYGIDTTRNKTFRSDVYQKYDENINIKKTEYESMDITVFDTDPLLASQIVDSIIHYFDMKARGLQVEKSYEVMLIAEEQLEYKKAEMDSLDSILHDYSKNYNILDFKSQSKEVTRAYMKNLTSASSRGLEESRQIFEGLKEKGTEFFSISENLWRVRGTYNDLKQVYENAKRDVYKKLTYANVVTKPFPSDKKSYPVRWLIVLISVGASLVLAFTVLLVINTKKIGLGRHA